MNTENQNISYAEIVELIRDKRRQVRGMFVAIREDNEVSIGWSLCKKKSDVFNKDRAFNIAFGRAVLGSRIEVPHSIRADLLRFYDRASRYFKNTPLIYVPSKSFPFLKDSKNTVCYHAITCETEQYELDKNTTVEIR